MTAGGRPSPDRNWTEVFAQLVGTVLSVWDAQRLDEAGEDGEVVPTFINLADASIKMVRNADHSRVAFELIKTDRVATYERPKRTDTAQRPERFHGGE